MTKIRLNRDFYETDATTLSINLIGKTLVHKSPYGEVRGIITETEGYLGEIDKASHAYKGKRTPRTEPMFHEGGTSYVYLIYGIYSCMNIVANSKNIAMASLLRMVEPADESSGEIMIRLRMEEERNRWEKKGKKETLEETKRREAKQLLHIKKHLADGPGKLCIAMGITKEDNFIDMAYSDDLYLTEGIEVEPGRISHGKRIGIDYAEEAADYLWRYTLI